MFVTDVSCHASLSFPKVMSNTVPSLRRKATIFDGHTISRRALGRQPLFPINHPIFSNPLSKYSRAIMAHNIFHQIGHLKGLFCVRSPMSPHLTDITPFSGSRKDSYRRRLTTVLPSPAPPLLPRRAESTWSGSDSWRTRPILSTPSRISVTPYPCSIRYSRARPKLRCAPKTRRVPRSSTTSPALPSPIGHRRLQPPPLLQPRIVHLTVTSSAGCGDADPPNHVVSNSQLHLEGASSAILDNLPKSTSCGTRTTCYIRHIVARELRNLRGPRDYNPADEPSISH